MSGHVPNLKIERMLGNFALAMWFVSLAVIAALVWHAPMRHSDCWNYYQPAKDWWAGLNLYRFTRIDGFLYLPQFALLYSPFALLGHPIGDIAWRGMGLALFGTGLWRISRSLSAQRAWIVFALLTAACLPPAIASLRNGEANLHIAGLMLQAAVDLRKGRWNWAAFWLAGGIVVKPIMIVMMLLAGAMYRQLIGRLLLGVAIIATAPFLFGRFDYVVGQYRAYEDILRIAGQPSDLYCNIRGLLGMMGWVMPQICLQILGLVAAFVALLFCLFAARNWGEPFRVFFLLGFSACYLMLCNPRTESSSYLMLAPVIAIPAAMVLVIYNIRGVAPWLYLLSFMLICDSWAYRATENWLKPLTGVIVTFLLIRELFRGKRMDFRKSAAERSAVSCGSVSESRG